MFAFRNIARAAPRSVARFSTKAARPQSSLLRAAASQPWVQTTPRMAASLHMSAVRRQESSVRDDLLFKLQDEITIEQDQKEDEDLSSNIKEFLESSAFELEDKPGVQDIVLTRTFGDEKIRVTFTTADLSNNVPNEYQDQAYDDADEYVGDAQSGGANTKGAINQGNTSDGNIRVAPEDSIAPADREELSDEYEESDAQGFPARANIRIERPGKGAIAISATAQDGDFVIEDLSFFKSADLADPETAEADWQRQALYTGPPFNSLDEDLQIFFEKYLEERGINTRLALFIPDYIDHKEQKEYIRWLQNVKSFIE